MKPVRHCYNMAGSAPALNGNVYECPKGKIKIRQLQNKPKSAILQYGWQRANFEMYTTFRKKFRHVRNGCSRAVTFKLRLSLKSAILQYGG